jgi:AcrR family transcriptional regulator
VKDAEGGFVTPTTTRARLVAAAFASFEEHGWEETTVDQIAARAGVGRTTFFRTFRTKTEVVFPDHETIMEAVGRRLAAATPGDRVAAADAACVVLRHYLNEGPLARSRYALTTTVQALRDREVASASGYQRAFYKHFAPAAGDPLEAELRASVVVTVHNHVLRSWLRGRSAAPEAELRQALADVLARLDARAGKSGGSTTVAIFRTPRPVDDVLPALKALLQDANDKD